MQKLEKRFETSIQAEGLSCLFFDGRKDDTNTHHVIDGKNYPAVIEEEHYSVCKEPGGEYLFHFVPEEIENKKHAEIIADHMYDWLTANNIEEKLQAVGGDSTNVNTGWKGGAMHWLEVKLGRKLVWIVCDLHTGELPLRHLIIDQIGPTLSNDKWPGVLGDLLEKATELEVNPNFTRIKIGPPVVELSDEIMKDLSTDQAYAYQILNVLRGETDHDDIVRLRT